MRLAFGSIEPRRHFEPGAYRADPELGWALRANYRGRWKEKLYAVPVVTDEHGFRMPPGAFERYRTAPRRVLVLGDSITFGQGVRAEETYPTRLEALLRAQGVEASVLNAGVPGYDTGQERRVLERLLEQAAPHAVVLGWYANDVTVASQDVRERIRVIDGHLVDDEAAYRVWRRKIEHSYPWDKSALIRWTNVKLRNWSWRRKTLRKRARQTREARVIEENLAACLEELGRIRDACRAHGAQLVVALFVPLELVTEPDMPARLWERVRAFCEAERIPVVDLRAPFQDAARASGGAERLYVYADRCHPSAVGHLAAAEALLPLVREALATR